MAEITLKDQRGAADLAGLLGLDEQDLIEAVRKGLPYDAYERLLDVLGIPSRELAEVLMISERTLRRRRAEGQLAAEESDRLVRVARLVELTLLVFEGDAERAMQWFTRSKSRLNGESPLVRSNTELGAHEVEDMLYAIEFTMPA